MEHVNTHKHIVAIVSLLCAGAIACLILYIVVFQKNPQPGSSVSTYAAETPAPTQTIERQGSITLMTKDKSQTVSFAKPIHIIISADSAGESLTGFDAVLQFDTSALSFVSATSLDPAFTLYKNNRDTGLNMTGVIEVGDNMPHVFVNAPLVEVVLQPKKIGSATVVLQMSPGETNDSNLINNQTSDILGSVTGVTVDVVNE